HGRELKDRPTKGRKIKVVATLTEKLENVTLHFMLAEDANNRKKDHWGNNLPASWKWGTLDPKLKHKDKKDRKDLIHVSANTNASGVAETQALVLSRFGGDKFKLGAYIDQDPHLAKYNEGDVDLAKHKPVLSTDAIEVWRKMSMQNTY